MSFNKKKYLIVDMEKFSVADVIFMENSIFQFLSKSFKRKKERQVRE